MPAPGAPRLFDRVPNNSLHHLELAYSGSFPLLSSDLLGVRSRCQSCPPPGSCGGTPEEPWGGAAAAEPCGLAALREERFGQNRRRTDPPRLKRGGGIAHRRLSDPVRSLKEV